MRLFQRRRDITAEFEDRFLSMSEGRYLQVGFQASTDLDPATHIMYVLAET